MKKIDFNIKNQLIQLSGTCFWYWNSFYSFLESCGISSTTYRALGKEGGKYQVMRSVLELLERQERYDIIEDIIKQFYNFKPSEEGIDKYRANELLTIFRQVVGKSVLEQEVDNVERKKKIEQQRKVAEEREKNQKKLNELKTKFQELCISDNKQARGYAAEDIFFELLELEEFETHRPYKNTGEQLDGYFKYEKFDYIVEIKWTKETTKKEDLSIFDGKIKNKAQSTRGFFVSFCGFDEHATQSISGYSPRIILMDGQDFMSILEERTTFYDLMRLKTDMLARKGIVYTNHTV